MKYLLTFKARYLFLLFFFLGIQPSHSQGAGYQINFKIANFYEDELILAYHYGNKRFIKHTAKIQPNGWFLMEGDEPLASGVYMAVVSENNDFIEIIIDEDNQQMSFETDLNAIVTDMKVSGSDENEKLYEYLKFMIFKESEAFALNQQFEYESKSSAEKFELQKKMDLINQEVEKYQKNLIDASPNSMLASIIKANMPLEGMPKFTGDQEEIEVDRYLWTKKHWFDNVDITDPRLLHTPILFEKVNYYIHNLTDQHPDSIAVSLDEILGKVKPSEEVFKFFLVNYLNEYATSKIVGMDAVYVHLAKNYYKKGFAPWTDQDQLNRIVENGDKLEPLLIGKIAPDIIMTNQNGQKQSLHDFESPFTVLFFWSPDCAACKASAPKLVDFVNNHRDKGVAVFSVCTNQGNEEPLCWTGVEDLGMNVLLNTTDPDGSSHFMDIYDIKRIPQVYVLDRDKKILIKNIGLNQLPEIFDFLLKNE